MTGTDAAVMLWAIGLFPTLAAIRLLYDWPPERQFVTIMLWPVTVIAFAAWLGGSAFADLIRRRKPRRS